MSPSPKNRMLPTGERLCNLCGPRPIEAFSANRAVPDGLSYWCRDCISVQGKLARDANPEREAGRRKRGNQRLRARVLAAYGSACACCGETTPQFLAIDHIGGGGGAHRREVGRGTTFYRWLVREGFPRGFRVLCHNCNQAIGYYGHCPHREEADVMSAPINTT